MQQIKTTFFIALLTGLILFAGYYVGGQQGVVWALVISAVMNFGSYWFSDKIVLALYKAKLVDSASEPRLHSIMQRLTALSGLPMPKLYKIDMPTPNAFATGRNAEHAAVAVTSGLMNSLNDQELTGVLAHELGHINNKDILLSSLAATLAGAISYLAQMMYWTGLGGGRRDEQGGGGLALLILTPIVATLLHLAVSRSREYLADEWAARLNGKPLDLASALAKLEAVSKARPLLPEPKYEATAHLFIVNPFRPSLLTSLFSTHPPITERIKRLKALSS